MQKKHPTLGFYLSVIPAVLLAWRLVWEQTSLSWERGPQMVAFSLMHSGLGIVLVFAVYGAIGWAVLTFAIAALSSSRRNMANVAGAVVVALATTLAFLPYGIWVQLFAERIAKGPPVAEFLVEMAALGETSAVAALLANGVPINASNRSGIRAIEAAENAKQAPMREYLVTRGGTDKRF